VRSFRLPPHGSPPAPTLLRAAEGLPVLLALYPDRTLAPRAFARALGESESNLHHHLAALEAAGLIRCDPRLVPHLYRLTPTGRGLLESPLVELLEIDLSR
jgi:DNA-binding transcriptional ArsR family regulator